MRRALALALAALATWLAVSAAQPQAITLPSGAQLTVWLKNHRGEDTTRFYPGDTVVVTFYSAQPFNLEVDAWLIYPRQVLPPRRLANRLPVAGAGGEVRPLELSFRLTEADPEGLYAVRIRVHDPTRNWTSNDVDLTFTFYKEAGKRGLALDPFLITAVVIAVVVSAALAFIVFRGRGPAAPAPQPLLEEETLVTEKGTVPLIALAKLEAPGGRELVITDVERVFGRSDFEGFLPWNAAQTISRRHFRIFYRGGRWYVEDLGSTNGTLLNGQEIRGRGSFPLDEGDVISPAGVINLVFREVRPQGQAPRP